MMTGGAFGMIKPGGGGQKSLRSGPSRCCAGWKSSALAATVASRSTYGQLIAQYFPGSNIDAWFEASGVPQNMREYCWTYALGKTKSAGATLRTSSQINWRRTTSFACQRLSGLDVLTRASSRLAGTWPGAYANREQANRWMNDLMGSFLTRVIPSATSQGATQFIQFMPDTMEQIADAIMESSGSLGRSSAA